MYLSWSRYFILIFICSVLLIGSTAIAYMHMGAHAAIATLTTASYACVIYLLIALAIWSRQRHSSRYGLAAACMLITAAASMTLAASLPIFFAAPIGSASGSALALLLLLSTWRQSTLSRRHFSKRWAAYGRQALQRSISGDEIDLNRLVDELQLKHAPFYLFGKNAIINTVVGALLLGSLVVGLNIRRHEPMTALFLWSVPGLLLAAWIAHPVIMAICQWRVIARCETEGKKRLVATGEFW